MGINTGGVQGPSQVNPADEGPAAGLGAVGVGEFKVRTLEDVKKALIEKLGPEQGEKLYKDWMKSVCSMMLTSMQKSADHALAEQKKARQGGG